MRPRSRLLTKRGLPTIREGYEELVQDLNQTNSQHSTTQDYLLSICHLARPTFPLHEPDCDILSIGPLDPPKTCIRLLRLRQHLQRSTICPAQLTPNQSETTQHAQTESHSPPNQEEEGPGPSDPLEYLYSHAGELPLSARRGSVPPRRPEMPPEMRRKSSCPELGLAETTVQTLLQRSPINRRKLDDGSSAGRSNKYDGAPSGWRGKSNRCMDKQTMVSHWIAECRSAWKEARVHACMLPSIAEK